MNKVKCVDISFSSRERIALRQALIDEIEKLTKNRFLDEDKRENRIIICQNALSKVMNTLHKEDFKRGD